MTSIVFDSSAIIAALVGEPGEDKVRSAVSDGAISAVNYAEIVAYLARSGASRRAVTELLAPLPVEIVPFDAALAVVAGTLVSATREAGLSLGDRACLALALARDAEVLTADRNWTKVAKTVGVAITLIR